MITKSSVRDYKGYTLYRGEDFLYIPPHALLRPFISNYTITFPTPVTMPAQYTIMPSASSTLVFSVDPGYMKSGLNGAGSKAVTVGEYANKFMLLLLIEFHPTGLYPLIKIDQDELADDSVSFNELDSRLNLQIQNALLRTNNIDELVAVLDQIFLARLCDADINPTIVAALDAVFSKKGNVDAKKLAAEVFYSERHLNRLFGKYIGIGIKSFSRIVRVNNVLRMLQNPETGFAQIAEKAGYFDQPHFNHDFKTICGITPQTYLKNKSVYYNENFKL